MRFTNEGSFHLSSFQRSHVQNLLRKFFGDKKVAYHIWQHGLATLFDAELRVNRESSVAAKKLKSNIDEAMK